MSRAWPGADIEQALRAKSGRSSIKALKLAITAA